MSQITRCPSCTTSFKVVADQLRISQGWVRCGQCKEVFDAEANMVVMVTPTLLPEVPLTSAQWSFGSERLAPVQKPTLDGAATPRGPLGLTPAGGSAPVSPTDTQDVASAFLEPAESLTFARFPEPFVPSYLRNPTAKAPDLMAGDGPVGGRDESVEVRPLGTPWDSADNAVKTPWQRNASAPEIIADTPQDFGRERAQHFAAQAASENLAAATSDLASTPPISSPLPWGVSVPPIADITVTPMSVAAPSRRDEEAAASGPLPTGVLQEPRNPTRDPTVERQESPGSEATATLATNSDAFLATDLPESLALVEHDDFGAKALHPSDETPGRNHPTLPDGFDSDAGFGHDPAQPEVSFVTSARRKAFWRKPLVRILLMLVVLLSTVALAGQIAVQERGLLAAMEPRARPWLVLLCEQLKCTVPPHRQIESIAIESSSFVKSRGDSYQLLLTITNKASVPLAMPAVELTLTDSQDQAVLRRVLLPADLAAPAEIAAGDVWSTTVAVVVTTGGARVAGYRVLAFYP